jgi:hypothetical protein
VAPAIVFVDELDAIGRARSGSGNGLQSHDEREQTLNQILPKWTASAPARASSSWPQRHSGARTVRVSVQEEPELRLCISDDGGGFDPELVRQSVGRFGLRGMSQRVGRLGGDLRTTSRPGRGTEALVILPWPRLGRLRRDRGRLDQVGQCEVGLLPERTLELAPCKLVRAHHISRQKAGARQRLRG